MFVRMAGSRMCIKLYIYTHAAHISIAPYAHPSLPTGAAPHAAPLHGGLRSAHWAYPLPRAGNSSSARNARRSAASAPANLAMPSAASAIIDSASDRVKVANGS